MLIRQLVIVTLVISSDIQYSTSTSGTGQTLRVDVTGVKASPYDGKHTNTATARAVPKRLELDPDAEDVNGAELERTAELQDPHVQVKHAVKATPILLAQNIKRSSRHISPRDIRREENVQSDDSDSNTVTSHDNPPVPAVSSPSNVYKRQPPSENRLGVMGNSGNVPQMAHGEPQFRLPHNRFLPLILMGDPEPDDTGNECTFGQTQSENAITTYVDAFDRDGCASCELDDEDEPDYFSSQLLPAGLDSHTETERLRGLLQAGLLDKDTFSAEDGRRGMLRLGSHASTNCTCSVGDLETVCSVGGADRFCDQLPYTTIPSGILEVSHTNISELNPSSLDFVANVSVLRLAWNEIARIEPGAFANMSLLTNLSLAHNRLQSLDQRTFSGATGVREIILAYNMFTDLKMATRALSMQLTPKLAHLNIGGNNFSTIGPQDLASMHGVPLEDLQLHENNIEHIDPTTFLEFKNLRRLRLRNNRLPISDVVALVEEMNNTSLDVIDLSMIGDYTLYELGPILNAVADSTIVSLMLNHYCFPNIYGFYIPKFPELKELSMRSCRIKYIAPYSFNAFTVLESLDLRDNYFTYVPSAVLLPTLISLDLSRPALQRYSGGQKPSFSVSQYRFRDMVILKYLDLSYNNITILERGAFVGLENLTALLLKDTELQHIANFSFSMLENLSELHLSGNFLSHQPFEHLWQGLTGLTVLFLDHCRINTSDLYLSEMPRAEILNLTGNSLNNLTSRTFHGLSSLNTIDLSYNSIVPWNEQIFTDSHDLERVFLRYNDITSISTPMAEDFLALNLRVLMLGFNPFHCSCQLHDWLDGQDANDVRENLLLLKDRNGGYITNDIDDCYCHSPEVFSNLSVLEFYTHVDLSPCAESSLPIDRTRMLLTMLPVFVSGMVAALAIRLVYKNRWYLRYWLFKLTSKRWLKKLRKDSEGFLYDAFVSYSSEDAGFVSEMIRELEQTPPFYRLCIYERDFEIGNVISECILESINTSRKSILILTDHFAKSHWCRWEMNLVQCRLFEQTRDDLILVKLGKIRSRHLTPTIRYLMRTRIYIEWGPSAQQQLLFWERLRTALRRPGGTPELPRTV